MTELHAHLRTEMSYPHERQQENADRHRLPAPTFQIGSKVWLNAKNIRTQRPSRKLDNKRHGPYKVKARVGTHAYRLELPNTMKIQNVFRLFMAVTLPDRPVAPTVGVIILPRIGIAKAAITAPPQAFNSCHRGRSPTNHWRRNGHGHRRTGRLTPPFTHRLPPVGVRDGYSKGQKDNDTSSLCKARTWHGTAPSRGASEPFPNEQNTIGSGRLMLYDQSSWDGEQASPPPPKPFTLVQHNCLGSWDVFLSLFGSFTQLAHPPSIVAVQDRPVYRCKLPLFNLFTAFSPSTTGGCEPWVAFYVYSSFLSTISLLPRFFGRGDVMALDLFTPDGFFNPSTTGFTIINSYTTKVRANNTRSVPPDIIFPSSPLPTLTLGDLNIHHPRADPLRVFKDDEIPTSTPYFDRATDLGFSLLNTLGVFTRFSMSLIGRRGVLDLAFACPLLTPYITEWSDTLRSTGSDHIPILLCFEAHLLRAPPPTPNWALTDWATMETSLKSTSTAISRPPPLPTTRSLDIWFSTNLGRVTSQFALYTPQRAVTYRSKPWWSELLLMLRKAYNSALRTSKTESFQWRRPHLRKGGEVHLLQGQQEGKEGSLVLLPGLRNPTDCVDGQETCCQTPPSPLPGAPGRLYSA